MKTEESVNLETYLAFFRNPHHGYDLTIKSLNKIIAMHGFKKIHKQTKNHLVDALNTVDLMFPYRSTVFENSTSSSSDAWLAKEVVERDLATLEWKECNLQWIETIGRSEPVVGEAVQVREVPRWVKPKRKSRKKRTRRSVRAIGALAMNSAPSETAVAVEEPFSFEW